MKRMTLSMAVAALTVLCVACATYRPQDIRAGQSEAELTPLMGKPTARYTMPSGQQRLEFATGPQGRVTWMVDVDAQGRVVKAEQVLNEQHFAVIQKNFETMNLQDLLRALGRPAHVRSGGWQGGQVWSWRYPTNECFWFQVSILDDGKLRDGGTYGIDPQCDPGDFGGAGRR